MASVTDFSIGAWDRGLQDIHFKPPLPREANGLFFRRFWAFPYLFQPVGLALDVVIFDSYITDIKHFNKMKGEMSLRVKPVSEFEPSSIFYLWDSSEVLRTIRLDGA
jgi:hypothetical protein